MAAQTTIESAWLEREALKSELECARQQISDGSHAMKHSLNVRERAREFVRKRPMVTAMASLAAGAVATRVIPVLVWRKKGLLGKFTAELAKGFAGMAVPFILNRMSRSRALPLYYPPDPVLDPFSTPHTNNNMTALKIEGSWNQVKGKLKQKYAQLTDDDLLFEEGKEEELLGRLQKRTGETKEAIRDFIARI
jgi:uncharacterized protein YjbJ (UPF0337 family)